MSSPLNKAIRAWADATHRSAFAAVMGQVIEAIGDVHRPVDDHGQDGDILRLTRTSAMPAPKLWEPIRFGNSSQFLLATILYQVYLDHFPGVSTQILGYRRFVSEESCSTVYPVMTIRPITPSNLIRGGISEASETGVW